MKTHTVRFRGVRFGVGVAALLGAHEACALQGWINKGTGSMNETSNWSAKVLPETTQTSANSAWCFWYAHTDPTTLTLDSDLVTDRLVVDQDKSGADATFDLGIGKTLTFKGTTGFGIRIHRANDVNLRLTSGKIVVDSATADNNILYFPSASNNDTTGKPGERNTFLVTGANSEMVVPTFEITNGKENALIVTNGATFRGNIVLAHANSTSNRVVFSGEGTTFVNTQASGIVTAGDHSGASWNTLEFSDGAGIENFQTLKIGAKKSRFVVRGAATALKTTGSRSTFGCSAGGENRLEITDGASLTLGGSDGRFWIGTTANTPSNVIWVSGAGSKFVAESTSNHIMGNGSGGGRLVVTESASASIAGSLRIGGGTGDGNVVRIEKGATATFCNVYPGHGENGKNQGNALEVVGAGSSALVTGVLYVGATTNSTKNLLRVADGATLTLNGAITVGDKGGANTAIVAGGATLAAGSGNGAAFRIGATTSDNALVVDGGTVTWLGELYTGVKAESSPGTNAIAVVNGGSLNVGGTLSLYGADNTFALTNGSVTANKMQLPYFNASDGTPTITLAGTNAVLRSATTLQIRRGASVVFAPTGKGYVTPPLQADDLQIIDGDTPARVTFDFSALQMDAGTTTVLAEGTTQVQFQPKALAAAKAALPQGYRLIVTAHQVLLRKFGGFALLLK